MNIFGKPKKVFEAELIELCKSFSKEIGLIEFYEQLQAVHQRTKSLNLLLADLMEEYTDLDAETSGKADKMSEEEIYKASIQLNQKHIQIQIIYSALREFAGFVDFQKVNCVQTEGVYCAFKKYFELEDRDDAHHINIKLKELQ